MTDNPDVSQVDGFFRFTVTLNDGTSKELTIKNLNVRQKLKYQMRLSSRLGFKVGVDAVKIDINDPETWFNNIDALLEAVFPDSYPDGELFSHPKTGITTVSVMELGVEIINRFIVPQGSVEATTDGEDDIEVTDDAENPTPDSS